MTINSCSEVSLLGLYVRLNKGLLGPAAPAILVLTENLRMLCRTMRVCMGHIYKTKLNDLEMGK